MWAGAVAGAAAVLFSMPCDCVKTRMELNTLRPPPGFLNGCAAFAHTGRGMVVAGGPRVLFVGIIPRLVDNVPSTMFYWLTVAFCRRILEPYAAVAAAETS